MDFTRLQLVSKRVSAVFAIDMVDRCLLLLLYAKRIGASPRLERPDVRNLYLSKGILGTIHMIFLV